MVQGVVNAKSAKTGSEVTKENILIYVAEIEEKRDSMAKNFYLSELVKFKPFFNNYKKGKMPTVEDVKKYYKINHSKINLLEMKTRLWKLREYEKSKNPNYYVLPRRAILLKEVQNWSK